MGLSWHADSESGKEAEVWALHPYGQISKRKHSFVCKVLFEPTSDGCKDMLSSWYPCLQCEAMALLRGKICLSCRLC